MPTITATPVPAAGLIQVDVDWSDNPTVGFARLERVTIATGEVQTVRPHTAILTALGQFMRLSNGRGRWFDTDAPFDTPVTYRVYAEDSPTEPWYGASAGAVLRDAFGRVVAAGATWGTPDVGPAYTAFATTTEASVAAGEGTLSLPTRNVLRGQRLMASAPRSDWDMKFEVGIDVMPLTDHPVVWAYLRLDAAVDNYVSLGVQLRTTSEVWYTIAKEVGGVATNLVGSTDAGFNYSTTVGTAVRVQAIGTKARIKLWVAGGTEPEAWTAEVDIPDVAPSGHAAIVPWIPTPNTNTLPYVFDFDNVVAAGSDAANSAQVTLDSEGHAWLRDPLRPCNSMRLDQCVDVSDCGDTNYGFELGTAAGWHAVNGTLTAEDGPSVAGTYRGKFTVDYTAGQTFAPDTPWPTTLYNWTVDAQGWVGEGGTTSVARVTSPVHDGAGALEATKTAMGAGTEAIRFNDAQGLRNLSANGPTLSVWAMVPLTTAGTGWVAHLEVQDPAFSWIAAADVSLVKGQWRLISFTPPAGLLANCRSIGLSFTGTGVSGTGVVNIDTLRQGAFPAASLDARLPAVAGQWVRVSGWVMAPVATQVRLAVNWVTAGGSWISASAGPQVSLVAGNWTYLEALVEAPAATATAEATVTTAGIPTSGTIIYLDEFAFDYRSPKGGAFFVGMDTESRAANSESVQPVNRRLAMTASRPRAGVESTLTMATARFTDRDNLIALTEPGTPLLFTAPAEYGIPPRYWDVGTTDVQRGLPDHRFQPRIHSLPIGEREAPAGPGKAPCGVSYDDGCANPALTTWAEVAAAGMTWLDLTDVS